MDMLRFVCVRTLDICCVHSQCNCTQRIGIVLKPTFACVCMCVRLNECVNVCVCVVCVFLRRTDTYTFNIYSLEMWGFAKRTHKTKSSTLYTVSPRDYIWRFIIFRPVPFIFVYIYLIFVWLILNISNCFVERNRNHVQMKLFSTKIFLWNSKEKETSAKTFLVCECLFSVCQKLSYFCSRMWSTAGQQRYPLRNRMSGDQTAAVTIVSEVIDLTRSTPSPQPSASVGIQQVLAGGNGGSASIATVGSFAVAPTASHVDLYTELQNLEKQEGVIWNVEQMFCAVCDLFVCTRGGILARNCLHQICTTCIKTVINQCTTIAVKCPISDCHYSLQDREIQSLLTPSEFEVHMNKTTVIESNDLYKDLLDLEQQGLIHNTEPFECTICFTEIDVCQGIFIRECLHQYCMDCIRQTINLSEEARIKCPTVGCPHYIHDREIRALLTQDEFEKYAAKTLRIAESQETNSYHCKKANCQGWCIVEDDINTFICPVCFSQNCLACQVKSHWNLTLVFIVDTIYGSNFTETHANISFRPLSGAHRPFIPTKIVSNTKMSFDMLVCPMTNAPKCAWMTSWTKISACDVRHARWPNTKHDIDHAEICLRIAWQNVNSFNDLNVFAFRLSLWNEKAVIIWNAQCAKPNCAGQGKWLAGDRVIHLIYFIVPYSFCSISQLEM